MPHIHTEPGQHDLTVSAFITDPNQRILIHKHKKLDRYLQPGGHVELNEDPWSAVLREIREETGYCEDQLYLRVPPMSLIDRFVDNPRVFHPYPISFNTHPIGDDGHLHTDIGFGFLVHELPREKPAPGESEDIRWINRSGIYDPAYKIPRNVQTIMFHTLTEVLRSWSVIHVSKLESYHDRS